MPVETIRWVGGLDGCVEMVDQRRLPEEFTYLRCDEPEMMWDAIRTLCVRGAPAIGVAGAMGLVLGVRDSAAQSFEGLMADLLRVKEHLETSRPTAVNLFWALERMERTARENADLAVPELKERLLAEAQRILEEDRQTCRRIGANGAELLEDGDVVLTHCNAGGLATADYGTALAVLFAAAEQGKRVSAYAGETRPLLQGARLTTWELQQAEIPVTLICDSMAADVMCEDKVDCVIVGADRIAANGDVANKVGTYGLSVLARHHGIPFYVAAPASTFDLSVETGSQIPIEQRDPEEITRWGGRMIAPEETQVYNPAFDVAPAKLVSAIITERGIVREPNAENISALLGGNAGD